MPIDSSKFFDSIRIKPNKLSAKQQAQAREESAMCEWPDCKNKGPHRAPKGRANDKEYWHFCLNHVREYNQSYNFFSGMNADAVARYQKDALTGHRPTWKMGANTSAKKGKGSPEADLEGASDPFSMFSELNGRGSWRPGPGAGAEAKVETRKIFNAERKALQVMGLGSDATLETVKAKYKALVKQHHPDANGGDRSTEDRLIEIIKAYNYSRRSFAARAEVLGSSGFLSNRCRGGLDHASAAPAANCPAHQRDDQGAADHKQHPVMLGEPGMGCKSVIFMQRRYREHARQHMRRCP